MAIKKRQCDRTIQAGLSAVGMFDKNGEVDNIIHDLTDVINNVEASSITYAIKDTTFEGVHVNEGDYMAISNKNIVAAGKDRKEVVSRIRRKYAYSCNDNEKEWKRELFKYIVS